jgi:hypothetical protein
VPHAFDVFPPTQTPAPLQQPLAQFDGPQFGELLHAAKP